MLEIDFKGEAMPKLDNNLLTIAGILDEYQNLLQGKHLKVVDVKPSATEMLPNIAYLWFDDVAQTGQVTYKDNHNKMKTYSIGNLLSGMEVNQARVSGKLTKKSFIELEKFLKQKNLILFNQNIEKPLASFQKRLHGIYKNLLAQNEEVFSPNYTELRHLVLTVLAITKENYYHQAQEVLAFQNKSCGFASKKELDARFEHFEEEYEYLDGCNGVKAKHLYELLVNSIHQQLILFEKNNSEDAASLAYDYAYKLMAILVSSKDINEMTVEDLFEKVATETDKLLQSLDNKKKSTAPYHDLLIELILPDASLLKDVSGWQNLIKKIGRKALTYFVNAKAMELAMHSKTGKALAPADLTECIDIAKLCVYPKRDLDPEFATLCKKYNVAEYRFNEALNFIGGVWPKKKEDYIPYVDIEGRDAAKGYYWLKVDKTDKRMLIMGDITDCCQSIGGHGEHCAKQAANLPDSGIYVLLRKRKKGNAPRIINGQINDKDYAIVGQSYAWRTKTKNLCLDSLEILSSVPSAVVKSLMQDFANKIISENVEITRVTLGRGGKTPKKTFLEVGISEQMKTGKQYPDSIEQYLLGEKALAWNDKHKKQLEKMLSDQNPDFIENIYYLALHYRGDVQDFLNQLQSVREDFLKHKCVNSLRIQYLLSLTDTPMLSDLIPINFKKLRECFDEEIKDKMAEISIIQFQLSIQNLDDFLFCIKYLSDQNKVELFDNIALLPLLFDDYCDLGKDESLIETIFQKIQINSDEDLFKLVELLNRCPLEICQEIICEKIGIFFLERADDFDELERLPRNYRYSENATITFKNMIYVNKSLTLIKSLSKKKRMTDVAIKKSNELKDGLDQLILENKPLSPRGLVLIQEHFTQYSKAVKLLQLSTNELLPYPNSERNFNAYVLSKCLKEEFEQTPEKLLELINIFHPSFQEEMLEVKKQLFSELLCQAQDSNIQDLIIDVLNTHFNIQDWQLNELDNMPLINTAIINGNKNLIQKMMADKIKQGFKEIVNMNFNTSDSVFEKQQLFSLIRNHTESIRTFLKLYPGQEIEFLKDLILSKPNLLRDIPNSLADLMIELVTENNMYEFIQTLLKCEPYIFDFIVEHRAEFLEKILAPLSKEQLQNLLKQSHIMPHSSKIYSIMNKVIESAESSLVIMRLLKKHDLPISSEHLPQLLITAVNNTSLLQEILATYPTKEVINGLFGDIQNKDKYYLNAMQYCARSDAKSRLGFYEETIRNKDDLETKNRKFIFVAMVVDYIKKQETDIQDVFMNRLITPTMIDSYSSIGYKPDIKKVSIMYAACENLKTPKVFEKLLTCIPDEVRYDLFFLDANKGRGSCNNIIENYFHSTYAGENLFLALPSHQQLMALQRHFYEGFKGRYLGSFFYNTVNSILLDLNSRLSDIRQHVPCKKNMLSIFASNEPEDLSVSIKAQVDKVSKLDLCALKNTNTIIQNQEKVINKLIRLHNIINELEKKISTFETKKEEDAILINKKRR